MKNPLWCSHPQFTLDDASARLRRHSRDGVLSGWLLNTVA